MFGSPSAMASAPFESLGNRGTMVSVGVQLVVNFRGG